LGRQNWLVLLEQMAEKFAGQFDSFHSAGTAGIVAMTGLDEQSAALANQREYSEPVRWLGSDEARQEFVDTLSRAGAYALQGGRFLTVSGDCDKGRALRWLQTQYAADRNAPMRTLAIGDSDNDGAMLDAADVALVIRSPVHGFPLLGRSSGVTYSKAFGPQGWAEGVAQWLADLAQQNTN
jgi:mannosyl-3-phosphoglycerate phosphatase